MFSLNNNAKALWWGGAPFFFGQTKRACGELETNSKRKEMIELEVKSWQMTSGGKGSRYCIHVYDEMARLG